MNDWTSDDGTIRLICGDCLQVMPTLEAGSVDMIWTDPPYGHNNASGDLISRRGHIMQDGRSTLQTPIANDSQDTMRAVVSGMLCEAIRVLRLNCCCCCCCGGGGGPSPTFAWVANRMDSEGLQFFHAVIWDKRNPGMGWRYRRQYEMVMVSHRRGGKIAWRDTSVKQPNIISTPKPRSGDHPNVKPTGLIQRFIELHCPDDGVVLDPFMGSGTTGVACVNLGRKFIGIELSPDYFEIAKRRIQAAIAARDERLIPA